VLRFRRHASTRRPHLLGAVEADRLHDALLRLCAHATPLALRIEAWPATLRLVTSESSATTGSALAPAGAGARWWEVERVAAMVPFRWPVPVVSVAFDDLMAAAAAAGRRRVRLTDGAGGPALDGRGLRAAGVVGAVPVPNTTPFPVALGGRAGDDAAVLFPSGGRHTVRADVARRLQRRLPVPLEAFTIDGSWFVRAEAGSDTTHAALLIGALEGPSVHPSPASLPVTIGASRPDRVLH
jgi:hypothetical protein